MTGQASAQTTLEIGIGTQNTTTNTVTGGIVLKELGLLEKHLPKTGKYKDFKYKLRLAELHSGPPITNGMMANNIQIGMMGDYPLLVNGATGQAHQERDAARRHHRLQRLRRGQRHRRAQGLAVLRARRSEGQEGLGAVRLRRARHDAAAMQKRGLAAGLLEPGLADRPRSAPPTCRKSASTRTATSCRSPSCCRTAASPARSIDGAETKVPTFHGVVVRKDFAEKYPEIVVAYIKALIEANDWMRKNPKAARREDRGVDQDREGGRLHLPRPRRHAHARPDHQAALARRDRAPTTRAAGAQPDQGRSTSAPGSTRATCARPTRSSGSTTTRS